MKAALLLCLLALRCYVESFRFIKPVSKRPSMRGTHLFDGPSPSTGGGGGGPVQPQPQQPPLAEFNVNSDAMLKLLEKRSYLSILKERALQALDDGEIESKVKQAWKTKSTSMSTSTSTSSSTNDAPHAKPKVVVLGTGWGSYAFLKTIDSTQYEVTVIAPRNFFLFTPMLAASSVGTVEFKSICDPIRDVNPLADYLEASATGIDAMNKKVQCQSIKCEGTTCEAIDFEVSYDYLVVAVGAMTATYGIKGVEEHCLFLKQIEDAANIRKSIVKCFERANVPNLTETEKRNMLSFVVVGAGPTGVEFTSELRDWLENEGRRYYGKLLKFVTLTLVEAGNTVLAVFDNALRDEALKRLTERETKLISDGYIDKEMTNVLLQAGVKEIDSQRIQLSTGGSLPYGFCVWAAGNGPLPFVSRFVNEIEAQKEMQNVARGRIVTDRWLKVFGTESIFSLGDCSFTQGTALPATAQVASQQGAYLGRSFSKGFDMNTPPGSPPNAAAKDRQNLEEGERSIYRSLSKPVQAGLLDDSNQPSDTTVEVALPFQFLNLGVLAYIGASQAIAQVSVDDRNLLGSGQLGFLLWRGVYWFKQVSWRNRMLVAIDWLKGRIFGRDIGSF